MATGMIVGASLGVVDKTLGLIGSGQQRKAQNSAQRHETIQMLLANRMQQNQIQQQETFNSQKQDKNHTTFIFVLFGIILIILIGIIVWKQSKK